MSKSEAEKIYESWATSDTRAKVSAAGKADGRFDALIKDKNGPFVALIDRLKRHQSAKGSLAAAETSWKLLEKIKRRQSETVAVEVLKSWKRDDNLQTLLTQFPASRFPNLSDDAQSTAATLDFREMTFPKSGKRIRILKVLGKGGVGGVVMLGEDQTGVKYAVKHLPQKEHSDPGLGKSPNVAHLARTQAHLMRFFEASVTTTCVDMLRVGDDQLLLLQLGEGTVNYATLRLSDVISVFQDLETCYNYAKNYMNVEVTQDVSVLHLDIHGENLMRFDGRLRMIDFGMALVHNPSQGEAWRDATPKKYDRSNPDLYFQAPTTIEDHKRYEDQSQTGWQKYITKWQQAYRIAPEVIVCTSCNRQYPTTLKMTECMRCGSKKLEKSKLRRADMVAMARLPGQSVTTVGEAPYAGRSVVSVNTQEYGCVVLTAVLIKEIWAATEKSAGDLGMKGSAARAILNEDVYQLARNGLPKYRSAAPGTSGVVESLLLWYDEMMINLFEGEKFTASDAVRFFGGGTAKASRDRRHSVSF